MDLMKGMTNRTTGLPRKTGRRNFVFLIVTIAAWPGPEEAIEVDGE
jgi:hypothetical protein